MRLFPVVEMFGPTIQGEGPFAGRNAVFLRLGGCNLACSWCDTPYSWDGERFNLRKEMTNYSVPEIMERMPHGGSCVITGGEPLLHQVNAWWRNLLYELRMRYGTLHLETNGTIEPITATIDLCDHISVSPKLPNAGRHRGHQRPDIWPGWVDIQDAILKFVVEDEADVEIAVLRAAGLGFSRDRVWVMPQGITKDELDKRWPIIAESAARHGIHATHRLQVLAWDAERGH